MRPTPGVSGLGRIACLGPPPSFSEVAARDLAPGAAIVHVPAIPALFTALAAGAADAAVLPVESNVAGPVEASATGLGGMACQVLAERWLPIRFSLYRRSDDCAPLKGVISQIMSLRQCARWIAERGLAARETPSNGAALAGLAEAPPGTGAIGPLGLALPGLTEAERDLQGGPGNATLFRLIALGHA